MERSKVPSCDECDTTKDIDPGFEAAEQEFVDRVCEQCPWGKKLWNPRLDRLLHYLALTDSPCRVDRHELRDDDWIALGRLKAERDKMAMEQMKRS